MKLHLIRIIAAFAALTMVLTMTLTSCAFGSSGEDGIGDGGDSLGADSNEGLGAGGADGSGGIDAVDVANSVDAIDADDAFSARDLSGSYDADAAIAVELSGEDGITITDGGVYILTGSMRGTITVDADKSEKVQLVLAGVDVTANGAAALFVNCADKVFVTLAEGTENTLSSLGEFAQIGDVNVDGAIFARDDITINGNGSLTVVSECGHGIVGKDEVTITGGTIMVTAASHAVTGKDIVAVADGELTLTAGKDGIHAENADDESLGNVLVAGGTFSINAEGDGISGNIVQIDGGELRVISGGGSANGEVHVEDWGWGGRGGWDRDNSSDEDSVSAKGVKAAASAIIRGGVLEVDSADDGIHSDGSVSVSGGNVTIATGDDGIHADGAVTIADGNIVVSKSYEGVEGATITVTGGDTDVTASDDGFNASDGNGDVGGMFGGGPGGGFGGSNGGFGGFGGGPGGRGGRGDAGRDGQDVPDIPDGPGGPGDSSGADGQSMPNDSGNAPTNADAGVSVFIDIRGGVIHVNAGGDGLDSNGAIYVSGGVTYVDGPENSGNGALDYATEAVIRGGTVIAVGASGMAEGFSSSSTQGFVFYNFNARGGNGTVTLRDSDGNVLATFEPSKTYNSVVVSTPGMIRGGKYTLEACGVTVDVTA